MIGFFPELLPNELLYSGFARYAVMVGHPSVSAVAEDLFGRNTGTAVIDLPGDLDAFMSRMPANSPYTAESLIKQHTMLPYYAPFVDAVKVRSAVARMRGDGLQGLHRLLNAAGHGVGNPGSLRFCRECAEEELAQYGWATWQRTPQAPGVLFCPRHRMPLYDSSVERVQRAQRGRFIALTEQLLQSATKVDLPSAGKKHWAALACDTDQLLRSADEAPDLQVLHRRYHICLEARGFIGPSGVRAAAELERAFERHFGKEFLRSVGCALHSTQRGTWLRALVALPHRFHRPLEHLLFIRFVAGSMEAFLDLGRVQEDDRIEYGSVLPSSTNVWERVSGPCRSPVCTHFDPDGVKQLRSGAGRARYTTVDCPHCGFAYRYDNNCSKTWALIRTGDLWNAELARRVHHTESPLKEISKALGVGEPLCRRLAWELGHVRPTWTTPGTPRKFRRHSDVATRIDERFATSRAEKRAAFLRLREQFPEATRNVLQASAPALLNWLRRRDRDWLEAALPAKVRGPAPTSGVDWAARDEEVLAQATRAVAELRSSAGLPKRLTRTLIAKELRRPGLIQQYLHRLPRTAAYLAEHSESAAQVAARRLEYASKKFVEEGRVPGAWTLARRAGFASVADVPQDADLPAILAQVAREVSGR